MALYRERRETLDEALKTTVIVKSREELLEHIQKSFDNLKITEIKIEKYPEWDNFDPRIGWYTHIVLIKTSSVGNFYVAGFLSEEL